MIADWVCVFDDGHRPYAPGLSPDQRRPLRLVAGENVTIRVKLVNPAGAPVELGAGHLAWNARTTPVPASRKLLTRQATRSGAGVYEIAIAAADTGAIAPQRAVHDLWAVTADGERINIFPLSELVIARSGLGAA